jgi:hypothetical protein
VADLETICEGVLGFVAPLRLGPGFVMPIRMTALPLEDGSVALVSPIAIDDATARVIEARGPVGAIVAPNLLHHVFLRAAAARWPGARILAPEGLGAKEPAVRIDAVLGEDPAALGPSVQLVPIEGAPAIREVAIFHRPSKTLVVTDLVFNIRRPRGVLTPIVLRVVGAHDRLAQSRAFRFMVKDRRAAAASCERLVSLDFDRLVVAHGDVIDSGGREALAAALGWMLAG